MTTPHGVATHRLGTAVVNEQHKGCAVSLRMILHAMALKALKVNYKTDMITVLVLHFVPHAKHRACAQCILYISFIQYNICCTYLDFEASTNKDLNLPAKLLYA